MAVMLLQRKYIGGGTWGRFVSELIISFFALEIWLETELGGSSKAMTCYD